MSEQKFSAAEREAFWLAYQKKCPYTSQVLDLGSFHIDHLLPEKLLDNPAKLEQIKAQLNLPADFDLRGYGNLLPCKPGANLQKGDSALDQGATHFFLSLASSKKKAIEAHVAKIAKRNKAGRAIVLLLQAIDSGDLSPSQVAKILEKHVGHPEEIFTLLQRLQFANADEVEVVAKADIEQLRDRPIKLGQNKDIDGVSLTKSTSEKIYVRTCREYDAAVEKGFYAYTTFDITMAIFFEHQCGLLKALQSARTAQNSFINKPHVGIVDLKLLPFTLFPVLGPDDRDRTDKPSTYQGAVDDGSIVIRKVRQNLVSVQETGGGMAQQLVEVARADFDGDGIEDILVYNYFRVTDGTFRSGGVLALTRKSPDGLFEIISI